MTINGIRKTSTPSDLEVQNHRTRQTDAFDRGGHGLESQPNKIDSASTPTRRPPPEGDGSFGSIAMSAFMQVSRAFITQTNVCATFQPRADDPASAPDAKRAVDGQDPGRKGT